MTSALQEHNFVRTRLKGTLSRTKTSMNNFRNGEHTSEYEKECMSEVIDFIDFMLEEWGKSNEEVMKEFREGLN